MHVLIDGRIVETGDAELARRVEAGGFDSVPLRHEGDHRESERAVSGLDVAKIQRDFPFSNARSTARASPTSTPASSSQKPLAVLDAMDHCYRHYYANIHRGVYTIAEEATAAYELAPQGRRFRRRRFGRRDRVRAQHDRGHQPRRLHVARRQPAGGFIEVKNTTLKSGAWALFPDAVTERGPSTCGNSRPW